MSIKTDRYLECDECEQQTRLGFGIYGGVATNILRAMAEEAGWSNSKMSWMGRFGLKDYCPECTKKRLEEEGI